MAPCAQLQDWISARLDDEIDSETRRVLEEHLASCKHCQAMEARYRWAKRALSQPARHEKAPESLHLWLGGVLKEQASAQRRRKAYAWVGLLVFIVMCLSGGWLFFRPMAPDVLKGKQINLVKEEVVSDHIRCMLRPGEKVDYKTTDPAEAQSWLQHYLDFAVKVPAVSKLDFELMGARVTYFLDRRVGGLLYKRMGTEHFASLFILNGKGLSTFFIRNPGESYRILANRGYEIAAWSDGDILYFFISHDSDVKGIAINSSDIGIKKVTE
jgi:anti-sigma factor RsiW